MADAPSNATPSYPGRSSIPGLPLSMTRDELVVAVTHIRETWWPQICRSSRERIADMGIFEEGWFDDDGLLDMLNPAFWKIVSAMGHLYGKVHARYQGDAVHKFRVRWQVARDEDMVYLLAEGKGEGHGKGFRIKSPRAGWVDFQMELEVLQAMRDAADATMDPSDAALAPALHIAGNGALVHSSTFRPTGGPAFSPTQRRDIAEQVMDALNDEVSHSRSAALSGDEQTTAKVSKWMEDQSLCRAHPDVQPGAATAEGASTGEEDEGSTHEALDLSVARAGVDDATAVPDIGDATDMVSLDEEWVKVGEGDEADDFTVPVASNYQYKREDAKVARKGWFGRLYYD